MLFAERRKYRAIYENGLAGTEDHQDFDCKNDAIVFLCWMGSEVSGLIDYIPLDVVEMLETAETGGIVVYSYA